MIRLTTDRLAEKNLSTPYLELTEMQNEYDVELMKLKHEERNDAFKITFSIIGMGIVIGVIFLTTL